MRAQTKVAKHSKFKCVCRVCGAVCLFACKAKFMRAQTRLLSTASSSVFAGSVALCVFACKAKTLRAQTWSLSTASTCVFAGSVAPDETDNTHAHHQLPATGAYKYKSDKSVLEVLPFFSYSCDMFAFMKEQTPIEADYMVIAFIFIFFDDLTNLTQRPTSVPLGVFTKAQSQHTGRFCSCHV